MLLAEALGKSPVPGLSQCLEAAHIPQLGSCVALTSVASVVTSSTSGTLLLPFVRTLVTPLGPCG